MNAIFLKECRGMATTFQVRIAGETDAYAAQAAQAAMAVVGSLEKHLSRFQPNSDIASLGALLPGQKQRVSEPVFSCLTLCKKMETATSGAFSPTAAALQSQPTVPRWQLLPGEVSVQCDLGKLEFDLGAIGKGFALDRMAEVLRDWDCSSFLLVAGGSSILAGAAPPDLPGWSCGLGTEPSAPRYWLHHCSLSGSGTAVKGLHIIDPRSGQPAPRESRIWALTDSAAESDALSTAAMVLSKEELASCLHPEPSWLVFLGESDLWRGLGKRALPPRDLPKPA